MPHAKLLVKEVETPYVEKAQAAETSAQTNSGATSSQHTSVQSSIPAGTSSKKVNTDVN